jgi:uncharacterized protein YdaU (DUF1376 family)
MKLDLWMPLYIGDWLQDTQHLDATANGAYWFLIMAHWGKPGVSSNDFHLRQITRVKEVDWARIKGTIAPFFEERDGLWINARCVEEYKRAVESYEKHRKSGSKGAAKRWQDDSKARATLVAAPIDTPKRGDSEAIASPMASCKHPQPHTQPHIKSNPLPPLQSPAFRALKTANLILSNSTGWFYDNCKVKIEKLSSQSLSTVIEPFVLTKGFDEKKVLKKWNEAVRTAHAAAVDGLARNPTAYCIECFREQLRLSV